jgi:hypothetical protein
MKKVLLLFCISSIIISCSRSSFTKEELLGTYISNSFMRSDDTIYIPDSTIYIHYGIRKCDNTRFSDTGRWELFEESEICFYKFIHHNLKDASIDTVSSAMIPSIFVDKEKICLNVGRDAGLYYIKQ